MKKSDTFNADQWARSKSFYRIEELVMFSGILFGILKSFLTLSKRDLESGLETLFRAFFDTFFEAKTPREPACMEAH